MKTIHLSNRISVYAKFHLKPSGDHHCVYVRFQVNHKDFFMDETLVSTDVICKKEQWNESRIKRKKDDTAIEKANARLTEVETVVLDELNGMRKKTFHHWQEAFQYIKTEIKILINPKSKKATKEQKLCDTFATLTQKYLSGKDLSNGYKQKFDDTNRLLLEFFERKKGEHVSIYELNETRCENFLKWLHRRMKHNAAATYASRLRTITLFAVDQNIISTRPLKRKGIVKGYRAAKKVTLTETEQVRLQNLQGLSKSEEKMRNIFLFMCATSLGYGELKSLRKAHFIQIGGERFIEKDRKKNGQPCIIPLSPISQKIYDQYFNWMETETGIKTQFEPFENLPSDSYCLRISKRLVKMAGIEKQVGTYTPRRTFATNYIRNGGSVYNLKAIMGHSNISQTMQYVHLTEEDLLTDAGKVYNNSIFHNTK